MSNNYMKEKINKEIKIKAEFYDYDSGDLNERYSGTYYGIEKLPLNNFEVLDMRSINSIGFIGKLDEDKFINNYIRKFSKEVCRDEDECNKILHLSLVEKKPSEIKIDNILNSEKTMDCILIFPGKEECIYGEALLSEKLKINDNYVKKHSKIIIEHFDGTKSEVKGIDSLNINDTFKVHSNIAIGYWIDGLETKLPEPILEEDLYKLTLENNDGEETILKFETCKEYSIAYNLLKNRYRC